MRKLPKVLFDFGGWNITLRELMFSFAIVGILTFSGFMIASSIEKKVGGDTLAYGDVAEIRSDDEFSHAMKNQMGHAFVQGRFAAKDPLMDGRVQGQFLSIRIERQRHTMHTQLGTTHAHRRHYWSWDTISIKERNSKIVTFCGVEFPCSKFNYSNIPREEIVIEDRLFSNERDVITVVPSSFTATLFAKFTKGGLEGRPMLQNESIETYRERLETNNMVGWFWTIWTISIILVVVLFFIAENMWLED